MADSIDAEIHEWEKVVDYHIGRRHAAKEAHPGWIEDDLRIAIYNLPMNALISGLLNAKMIKTTLLRNEWWDVNVVNNRTFEQRQFQTDQFVIHTKVGIYVVYLSMLEAVLRRLVSELAPGKCGNGFDPFSNIYGYLLKTTSLQQHGVALDFARELRNLIHHNGIYINKNGQSTSYEFDNVKYTFKHGQSVDFAYPSVLFSMFLRLLSCIDDLVVSQAVEAMKPVKWNK